MKLICETMNEEEGCGRMKTNKQNNKQKTQIKTLLQEPEL